MNRVEKKFDNGYGNRIYCIRLAILFGGFTTRLGVAYNESYTITIEGNYLYITKELDGEFIAISHTGDIRSIIKQIRKRKNKNQQENRYYFLSKTGILGYRYYRYGKS